MKQGILIEIERRRKTIMKGNNKQKMPRRNREVRMSTTMNEKQIMKLFFGLVGAEPMN